MSDDESEKTKTTPLPIPAWTWVFVVACAAIPVVSMGGAIPAAIGCGGAGGCIGTSRDPNKSTGTRVAICTAITAVCWALFGGMILAFKAN